MKPVRTRSPGRTLAALLAVWSLYAAIPLVAFRLRPDLPFLPAAWVATVGLVWLLGFVVPLAMAVMPRQGQVLPDGARALSTAAAAAAVMVLVSAVFTAEAPGHSASLPLLIGVRNCLTFAVIFSVIPVGTALFVLRRALPAGSWRVGAAVGAASGALACLVLHLLCPVAGASHTVFAHASAVVVCGALGAVIRR
jgi:hypothetical protein